MILKPKQVLNKAYLKVKPTRDQIKLFKENLLKLISVKKIDEHEEYHKGDFSDFLKDTYYKASNYINIKGNDKNSKSTTNVDLVIHSSIDPQSPVSILIEAKSPTNKTEMISTNNINTKSMQELILYYLRERISNNNLNLKHLIITNRYEWFIFDAVLFEKLFAQNKQLVNQFNDFEDKILSVIKTKDFYSEIAKPVIEAIQDKIEYTYFDIREYKKYLENNTPENDNKLIPLFKIFSPEHLLKLPIANDNNSLDKSFYNELLHIIGLEETKQGSKKIITRKDSSRRDNGSLLENCITELDNGDKLSSITNIEHYGTTKEERLFNVALELVIIWINRILFLKLLEGQLINFNKNSKDYAFLNSNTIKGYDDLNNLFFGVLAKQQNERSENNKKLFAKIPYLNSSLFDPQSESLEKACFAISALNYNRTLTIDTKTVLKDRAGKRLTGEKNTLEYLFEFLNAYNFASDSNDEIQEDSKTIINAAVLGLIFEKINGYKDGSFYTPSFITMYMCRETIRRAVVEQFNKAKSWSCLSFDDLYDKIEDRNEANNIINSITICDPAVGSGHFLVSALNEIISIKSELKLLQDRNGKRLKEYQVEIINDELIITDEDGDLFAYNPTNNDSQRVQEALFHEKQAIIENCLFGVDINPNSVKICRLRLWIELLKNTYYKNKENHELETLPNIDINIKCGNSLISRFDLDSDLIEPLKKAKIKISDYKEAVQNYRHARDKQQKMEMAKFIEQIKNNFETEIMYYDKRSKNLEIKQAQLNHLSTDELFATTQKVQREKNKKIEKLKKEVSLLRKEIDEITSNKIYENAFEWRFEFPEVLAYNGDFIGFDVVIGNPPYIDSEAMVAYFPDERCYYAKKYTTASGNWDLYIPFIEKSVALTKNNQMSFIIPNKWMSSSYATNSRIEYKELVHEIFDFTCIEVFAEAGISPILLFLNKQLSNDITIKVRNKDNQDRVNIVKREYFLKQNEFGHLTSMQLDIITKLSSFASLSKLYEVHAAASTSDAYKLINIIENCNDIDSDTYFKLVNTGTIDKYVMKWGGEQTSYLKNKYLHPVVSKQRYKDLFPNKNISMIREKIILSGIRHFEAIYDKNGSILAGKSTTFITPQTNQSIKSLIALLNSNLMSFYIKESYYSSSMGGGINFSPDLVRSLPIPHIPDDIVVILESLIDQVIQLKEINMYTDISHIVKEIDLIVYQLYDLNDEEIRTIESYNL